MPYVDIRSVLCWDEQEFGSDEVYVKIVGTNSNDFSPTYGDMDTNDRVYPDVDPIFFNRGDRATISLWEDDGSGGPSGGDDLIGSKDVTYTTGMSRVQTVTLDGSGGKYDVTYEVWL